MIHLSRPDITSGEIKKVNEVLSSPYLSGGAALKEFEEKVSQAAGTEYAVGVSSGTAALHLILLALGIGEGDEVITTPFSFIASANCILYVKAKPVFIDIGVNSFNIDPEKIEAKITPKTKAILVVHIFGIPAALDKIKKITEKHGLWLIEDACEAIGARLHGRLMGGWGVAGAFAFYPNKQITTGEGGAVVTNDYKVADLVRSLANQGRNDSEKWLNHVRLGFNYRLDEMSAALGCVQLDRLNNILEARRKVAEWYREELEGTPYLILPDLGISSQVEVSWFVYVIRFASRGLRDLISSVLAERGIETRPYFPAIHLQPVYKELFSYQEGSFPETEGTAAVSLALPFYNTLPRSQVREVCSLIKETILELYQKQLWE